MKAGSSQRRQRLDQVLVDRGLCPSRSLAQREIMAGKVRLNGHPASKPGHWVRAGDAVTLQAPDRYVSRGGHKLEAALRDFECDVTGLHAIDLGAATGGFTDCLLQAGAVRVHAVDVGSAQLAWKLRQDPRVVVMEKTNARHLTPTLLGAGFRGFDLAVIDCSFISLRKILPAAVALLHPAGKIVALIKPQFEAGKAEADRGRGVITDPAIHQRVLTELQSFVEEHHDMLWRRVTESPLLGPAGNKEFLVLIEKAS